LTRNDIGRKQKDIISFNVFVYLDKSNLMVNIDKQIAYWIEGAKNDLNTAELLVRNNGFCMVYFFAIWQSKSQLKHLL